VKSADIVVVGSGSLAAGVAGGLSQAPKLSLRVVVIGRSLEKAAQLARMANARSAIFQTPVQFAAMEIAEFRAAAFGRALRSLKPKVIFQTASLQSPWEAAGGGNGWTKLVAEAGFGITLPLQMALTAEVSEAAGDSEAAIVNACYPDCVNVALERTGLRVTCGIGNAGIVEAFCSSHAAVKRAEVSVVGHHGHLRGWLLGKAGVTEPRVWVKRREVKSAKLSPHLKAISEDLNQVTAGTATAVILALFTGNTLRMSVPGVPGLPGGYPFLVNRGKFQLHLPEGIRREEAIAHNQSGERMDGLQLGMEVRFAERARQALAGAGFPYADGYAWKEWKKARGAMVELRDGLRRKT
jgi:hypothetical protein